MLLLLLLRLASPAAGASSYLKSSLQSLARVVKPRLGPELVCLLLAPSLC